MRKESLDAVLPLSQSPKLVPGDYGDLVRALKKVITKVGCCGTKDQVRLA